MPRWLRAFSQIHRIGEVVRCAKRVKNWPSITARYIGVVKSYPIVFMSRSGVEFNLLNQHDLVTAWVIYCRDEYHVPKDAKLVVDIGANIGVFALQVAEQVPETAIVCVEPFPACHDRLTEAVVANRLNQRIVCWRFAIAAETGTRVMPTSGPSQSNGLLPSGSVLSGETVSVDAITLTTLLSRVRSTFPGQSIDFLKMDIEGGEHESLQNLPSESLVDVQAIGMEYHPNGDRSKLFHLLAEQGFVCVEDCPVAEGSGVAHFRRKALSKA